MRWRHIETAPHKADQKIIGYFPGNEYHSMRWSASDNAWQSRAWPAQPTHWRPPPMPPTPTDMTDKRVCKHGHVSPKYAIGRNCIECVRLRSRRQHDAIKANPEKREKHRQRIAEYRAANAI